MAWEVTVDRPGASWVVAMAFTALALPLGIMMCALFAYIMRNLEHVDSRVMEVIEILESPPPTRTIAAPKTPSTKRRPRSARRAGMARIKGGTRAVFTKYNPKLPN